MMNVLRPTNRPSYALLLLTVVGLLIPSAGLAGSDPSADELAGTVVETTGDPTEVEKLEFSFVLEVDGDPKVRRRHTWWPRKGKLEVVGPDIEVEFRHLHDHDLSGLAAPPDDHADTWNKVAPEADPGDAAEAWSWFINDSYWLLAPAKLFDPGVNRTLDDQGRLVLTFGEVGLTPGDRYTLTVDRERGLVTRWDYTLEDGKTGSFEWTDYDQFGPLKLSTRRVSVADEGPEFIIRFPDIEVTQ